MTLYLSKEKRKLKLIQDISRFENANDNKLIKALIRLEKYSTREEKIINYIRIADNICKLNKRKKKRYTIDLAINYYNKSLELSPINSSDIYNKIAFCYLSINNVAKGVSYLKKSILLEPDNFDIINTLLNIKSPEFPIEMRLDLIKELFEKYPSNSNIYYYFGLHFIDELDKSNEYFIKAIESNCSFQDPYYYLIERFSKKEDFSKVFEFLMKFIKAFPNSAVPYKKLGDFYRINSKFKSLDDAKDNYLKSIQIDSSESDIYKKLAEIYIELYEYGNAIKYYEIALNKLEYLSDNKGEILFPLAVLNNVISNSEAAVKYYLEAVKINKKYLSKSYVAEVFDYKILRMKNILRQNPKNKTVLYLLASRFYNFENFKEAMNYFNILYLIDPQYKDVKKKAIDSLTKFVDESMDEISDFNLDFLPSYENISRLV